MGSFISGLIIGSALSSLAQHYGRKFYSVRKIKTHIHEKINQDMAWLFEHYNDFMTHIKNNASAPESKNIKEFFVVDKAALMNSSTPRLRYDLSTAIVPALNKLEELGFIEKISHDSLLYRMNEVFLTQLNAFLPPEQSNAQETKAAGIHVELIS